MGVENTNGLNRIEDIVLVSHCSVVKVHPTSPQMVKVR